MIPPINIQIEDTLSAALINLMASRESQKGLGDAMDEAMQYWVSFAMAKQTVASKVGIREYLMADADRKKGGSPVRKRTARGKESTASRYLQLRDSRAAAIVWRSNYKGAQSLAPGPFFGLVGKYIARRQYSAGHHKAGFRPALSAFKVKRGLIGADPNYEKTKSVAFPAHTISDSIMEALVINAADGVSENPTGGTAAVEASKAEVVTLFETYTRRNIRKRARRLGI